MTRTALTTHSYCCILIEPHVSAEQVELLADQGKLRSVRVRAINAGHAERSAAHLTRLPVLRADRVEEDHPVTQAAQTATPAMARACVHGAASADGGPACPIK